MSNAHDIISNNTLKLYHKYLLLHNKHIKNSSLEYGKFPTTFKFLKVIPRINKDKRNKNNYKPIAITSVVNKQLEKCMSKYYCLLKP